MPRGKKAQPGQDREAAVTKKTYSPSDTLQKLAENLIANHHPEIATAKIGYYFVGGGLGKKAGKDLLGKVQKVSGFWNNYSGFDFILFIDEANWANLDDQTKVALIDHYLECITGEEDEKTGDMKWVRREPDVNEFTSILKRRGSWHPDLAEFIAVSRTLDIDALAEEVKGSDDVDLMN